MRRKPDPPIAIPNRVRSLVGQRFGRLLVQYYAGQDKHHKSQWCCVCDCGNVVRVAGSRLLGTSGKDREHSQKSCGCLRADPGIRRAARAKVPPKRRKEICDKMRKAIRFRRPAYSMPADRAAEVLNVSRDRIEIMVKDGALSGVWRKGRGLFVSSEEVASICATNERNRRVPQIPYLEPWSAK